MPLPVLMTSLTCTLQPCLLDIRMDLYKEAKAPKKRPCRFHKEGRSSRVRYRERKELRTFYREF